MPISVTKCMSINTLKNKTDKLWFSIVQIFGTWEIHRKYNETQVEPKMAPEHLENTR